jgi:glycosyltransferase involved in cell wall biosynthesis
VRVAIDGIAMSHPQPGGYRTYTTNLVMQMARFDRYGNFHLFVDRPLSVSLPPNWQVQLVSRNMPGVGVALRQQIGLPLRARRFDVDLLHSPCGTGPLVSPWPSVITLLDTIEFSCPLPSLREARLWAMRLYNRAVQAQMVRRAKAIITISEYSKNCIIQRFGIAEGKIFVTYLAPADHFLQCDRNESRTQVQETIGTRDYVLALASASPRKNIDRLLASYELLSPALRGKHPLVVVCTHPQAKERLKRIAAALDISSQVALLDRVSDEQLATLFGAAALFVFPSLEEGFGLPPLEAMAYGMPVVASNTSSMPEVLGDAALLVDPTDTRALADAMVTVLTLPALAEDLRQRGLQRSRHFSWETTARQTLAVYRSVAGP